MTDRTIPETLKIRSLLPVLGAPFPIVGIGASAGGLAAFEAFFSGMPTETHSDMAFVLVQHLAPDHKSILSELIQRYTPMQVFEVEDGMTVQPNCAYIIPPNCDMAFFNGRLQLLEPVAPRGLRLPIDYLFRSLAQDLRERAIGIVLSGTGSDGTLGVRAIKGEGGMVMVQTPESTEFDGMPRSAMATGLVDYELPPVEMAAQLMAYAAYAFGKQHLPSIAPTLKNERALEKIFVLLRAQTGHDFSRYKPGTLHRRIERRMAVHQIEVLEHYVKYLQQSSAEVEALFRDLLIGVTQFFRDPEAFQKLEERVIPLIFAGQRANSTLRIWSAACSTGEEAYSLAILLQERMETLKQLYTVQIFATDIDRRAIVTARAGRYPASIAADLTPERLARFFVADPGGATYRVHKGIRDMLIFSEHNLIKDPPFSRLDLIVCRNLLIYLEADLQKQLLTSFYHALNADGKLFLGSSEGVGDSWAMFTVLDQPAKLYQRAPYSSEFKKAGGSRFFPPQTAVEASLRQRAAGKSAFPVQLPLRELTEQAILQHAAPPSVLVNHQGDILYVHGRTGNFLEPAPGEVGISNLLKMARSGLRHELSLALHQASETQALVRSPGLRVKTNGSFIGVNLSVYPVVTASSTLLPPESALYLVALEEALPLPESGVAGHPGAQSDTRSVALERELRAKDDYLQSLSARLDHAEEELKSSNEEMRSVNEELQSTNEELETSQEELQSTNEELLISNTELQTHVQELTRLNNDMNNLLAGTGIATLFVDHQLRILRFTPNAGLIIPLIPGDVGRPLSHLVTNLVGNDSSSAVNDTQQVLNTLVPNEREVHTRNGQWYSMHIQPYRTLDNVIEGAVLSFLDITQAVLTREALHKANDLHRLAVVVRDARDAITVHDLTGRILAWNPGAVRLYGWSESEALQMSMSERIPEPLRAMTLSQLHQLSQAEILETYETQRLTKAGAVLTVWITATALINETGQVYAVATTEWARALTAESVD